MMSAERTDDGKREICQAEQKDLSADSLLDNKSGIMATEMMQKQAIKGNDYGTLLLRGKSSLRADASRFPHLYI
jgi:hypothetical protein